MMKAGEVCKDNWIREKLDKEKMKYTVKRINDITYYIGKNGKNSLVSKKHRIIAGCLVEGGGNDF